MTVNYIIKEKSSSGIKPLYLVLLYVIIYIILFEFILPVNFFLPRPFILGDSLFSLQSHYRLLLHIFFTASSIYAAIIAGYFLLALSAGMLIKFNSEDSPFITSLKVFKYFPIPGFAAIFALWLHNAILAESLFALAITYSYFVFKLNKSMNCIKSEYVDVIIPLGVKNKVIFREVIWKSLIPSILKSLTALNFLLWTVILVFEFFKGNSGIGYILRMSLEYQDLSGLLVLSVITGVLVFLGNALINLIQKKFIRWEP